MRRITIRSLAIVLLGLAVILASCKGATSASSKAWVVSTFAGTARSSGTTDDTGAAARFSRPSGVAVNSSGIIYVADRNNHTIRKIEIAGETATVSTLAGTARSSGTTDDTGAAARFSRPSGVAVDSSGIIYVADRNNHTIRKIEIAGETATVSTFAGTAGSSGTTGRRWRRCAV